MKRHGDGLADYMYGAGLLGLAIIVALSTTGEKISETVSPQLIGAVTALAAGGCIATALARPGKRLPRLILAGGLLSYAAGDFFFYTFQDALLNSYPTVPDLLWTAFYPCFGVAFFLALRPRRRAISGSLLLDGLLAGSMVLPLTLELLLDYAVSGGTATAEVSNAQLLLPILDIAFLIILVVSLVAFRGQIGRAALWMTAGFAVMLGTDTLWAHQVAYESYSAGAPLDVGWAAGMLAIGYAGRHKMNVSFKSERRPSWSTFAIPVVALFTALITLAHELLEQKHQPVVVAAACVVLLLVLVRLFISLREAATSSSKLRKSEQRYRQILETTTEGVWIVDAENRTTFANPRMTEILGYSEEEMLDRPFWDFLDEEGKAASAKLLKDRRPGELGQIELSYTRKDGSRIWAHLSTSDLFDDQGNSAGALAMVTDITKRKGFQHALEEREAQLAEAQKIAHLGSWWWNVSDGTAWWSAEVLRIFGLPPGFVASHEAFVEAVHPDDRESAAVTAQTGVWERKPFRNEYRIVRPDGAVRVIDSRAEPVLDPDGNVERMIGTLLDVTDRKLVEDELRLRVDQQAAISMLGREALSGTELSALMHTTVKTIAKTLDVDYARVLELADRKDDLILRAGIGPKGPLQSGARIPLGTESRPGHMLSRGSRLFVEDAAPEDGFIDPILRDEYGATSGVSVVIEDSGSPFGVLCAHTRANRRFTENEADFLEAVGNVLAAAISRDRAQRLQLQLQQAQRIESVGLLAGGIAHDFNNLLSVILNSAGFVLNELPGDDARRHDVEQIKIAAERAADLTHQLLVFSRREVVEPEIIDINKAIRETETLLRRTLGENIEVTTRLEPNLLPTKSAVNQVESVLLNLAVNARDAMPNGGSLNIVTENIEFASPARHGDWSIAPGRYARITVADNGSGMSTEVIARAFEPFFTTKPTGEGTGLGLATVYGIAKDAGGYVDIYSEPGHGTVVKVFFAAHSDDRSDSSPKPAEAEIPDGGGETILIVEDEDAVRAVAERILKGHDYDVIGVSDGESAIRICDSGEQRVDLLLTDVIMPGLSGRDLAARIRSSHPDIKTLYMSGYTGAVISRQGLLEEGLSLVEKPFTPKTLLSTVRVALDQRGSAPPLVTSAEGHA